MRPELVYPSEENPVYCHDCKEHIRENDLFGRFRGQWTILYCAKCFGTYCDKEMDYNHPEIVKLMEMKLNSNRRYTEEDLIKKY